MVKVRIAIEKLYAGQCTIIEKQPYTKANKATGFREVKVLENQPCRLSFSKGPAAVQTETYAEVSQEVKLFLAPEMEIKAGSRLDITQNGVTESYVKSGIPRIYATHQEISLAPFRGWA